MTLLFDYTRVLFVDEEEGGKVDEASEARFDARHSLGVAD